LKEEAVDRTLLRTRFGRRYGPGARQTAWWWWAVTSDRACAVRFAKRYDLIFRKSLPDMIASGKYWATNVQNYVILWLVSAEHTHTTRVIKNSHAVLF
jgi:hypothetical protein